MYRSLTSTYETNLAEIGKTFCGRTGGQTLRPALLGQFQGVNLCIWPNAPDTLGHFRSHLIDNLLTSAKHPTNQRSHYRTKHYCNQEQLNSMRIESFYQATSDCNIVLQKSTTVHHQRR